MEKNKLVEIKKGETGTGILIESDAGYISSDCGENRKLFEDINSNIGKGEFNCPYPFIVSAVFQKFGIEIANLLLQGIKIGVSSRGLGTVTNKMGVLYVADDYEIVCWDVVSDPSTPGAWIGQPEELQQYVEDNSTNKDKAQINEKINLHNFLYRDFSKEYK